MVDIPSRPLRSAAVLATLTNPFVTGTTLHVDGGGRPA
jgi:hypothetical protein